MPPLIAVISGWLFLVWRHDWARPFDPITWFRWDSGWYRAIARRGYYVLPCHTVKPGEVSHNLCGSMDWFPGYPAIVRIFAELTGLQLITAGLIIAWTCWYLTLVVFWQLVRDARNPGSRWACLLLAAFAPGQIYFAAYFPISMTVGGMLACIYFGTVRRAAVPAFVCGLIAASSYPTATMLAPALVTAGVLCARGGRLRAMLAGAAGAVIGFTSVLVYSQISIGMWNGFFRSEKKYGVGTHNPLATIAHIVAPLFGSEPPSKAYLSVVGAQTLLTSMIVVLICFAAGSAVWSQHRSLAEGQMNPTPHLDPSAGPIGARISALDATLLLMALATWLMPYVAGGHVASYRSDALIVVALPLLRRLPACLVTLPLVASAVVSFHLAPYFFSHTIA